MDVEQAAGAGGAGQRVPGSFAAALAVLDEAVVALAVLPGLLWQASGADLADGMGRLDRVAALAAAGRVAVTAEALARGEVDRSQSAGTAAWVAGHAPSLATGGAGDGVTRFRTV
jgi:hypothetical protein